MSLHGGPHRPMVTGAFVDDRALDDIHRGAHEEMIELAMGSPCRPRGTFDGPPQPGDLERDERAPGVHVAAEHEWRVWWGDRSHGVAKLAEVPW